MLDCSVYLVVSAVTPDAARPEVFVPAVFLCVVSVVSMVSLKAVAEAGFVASGR